MTRTCTRFRMVHRRDEQDVDYYDLVYGRDFEATAPSKPCRYVMAT